MILGEKNFEHNVRVLIFSKTFFGNISYSKLI